MNQFPQFLTEIDGVQVHFLHVRSPEPNAMPLILTHGWPGSFVEFIDVIDPLTNPAAHGGDPADAFHVVIPSMPGYGFSGPTRQLGWDTERVALAWKELMRSLGYTRYLVQGGDWGIADLAAARPRRSRARRRRAPQHAASRSRPPTDRRHGAAHVRADRVGHGAGCSSPVTSSRTASAG